MSSFNISVINYCESRPCLNGGSCVSGVNSYTCNCVSGYSGFHCQTGELIKILVFRVKVTFKSIGFLNEYYLVSTFVSKINYCES